MPVPFLSFKGSSRTFLRNTPGCATPTRRSYVPADVTEQRRQTALTEQRQTALEIAGYARGSLVRLHTDHLLLLDPLDALTALELAALEAAETPFSVEGREQKLGIYALAPDPPGPYDMPLPWQGNFNGNLDSTEAIPEPRRRLLRELVGRTGVIVDVIDCAGAALELTVRFPAQVRVADSGAAVPELGAAGAPCAQGATPAATIAAPMSTLVSTLVLQAPIEAFTPLHSRVSGGTARGTPERPDEPSSGSLGGSLGE